MTKTSKLIDKLRRDWSDPREAVHGDSTCPFVLHCEFEGPASSEEIEAMKNAPKSVINFWAQARSATLFKDGQYGQWGLRILDPLASLKQTRRYDQERVEDAVPGDLVIGTFLGDSDLLMVRRDHNASDYGTVMVVLPLDPRSDWNVVAGSFDEFLEKYVAADGGKFWEGH